MNSRLFIYKKVLYSLPTGIKLFPVEKKQNDPPVPDLVENLVAHNGHYSGAFILFGGWMKCYDDEVPSGTRGHELYCGDGRRWRGRMERFLLDRTCLRKRMDSGALPPRCAICIRRIIMIRTEIP